VGRGSAAAPFGVSVALASALIFTTVQPAGAAGSAQITIRGHVPPACSVSVDTDSTTLNLIAGQSQAPVATVTEQCNAAAGYSVTVTSANGGQLRQGNRGVGYTLSYDDAARGQGGGLTATRAATGASVQRVLYASVPATPTLPAGQYEDVVTVSISAK